MADAEWQKWQNLMAEYGRLSGEEQHFVFSHYRSHKRKPNDTCVLAAALAWVRHPEPSDYDAIMAAQAAYRETMKET